MESASIDTSTVQKVTGSDSSDIDCLNPLSPDGPGQLIGEADSTTPKMEQNSSAQKMEESTPKAVAEDPTELLAKGEYLLEYPSWFAFIGEDKRSQYTHKFAARNDLIWELLSTEQRYLHTLTMIREVYVKGLSGQNVYISAVHADLFPHLDQLITVHTALFSSLLRQHCAREDKIIENLGQCLLGILTSETINLLIECYGQLMFVQSSLNDRLTNLRKDMFIAEALANCERDRRTGRKTISDCYLIIVQRWTKVEPLISCIISNTVDEEDSTEFNDLHASLQKVQSLLYGAQQFMTDLVQAEKLRGFADHLQEDSYFRDETEGKVNIRDVLTAKTTKMVNYDMLKYLQKKPGEKKPIYTELHAIALNDYFLLLFQDKHTNKYRPFKINEKPFVIIWSKYFGLFRTSARHPLNFLLIMEQPDYAMHEFNCTTNDEVVRWQKVFTDGFAKCGRGKCVSKEKLFEEVDKNLTETNRLEESVNQKLEMINELDDQLFADWSNRNIAFAAYFTECPSDSEIQFRTHSRQPSTVSEVSSVTANNTWNALAPRMQSSEEPHDNPCSRSESENSMGDRVPVHSSADVILGRMEKTYNRFLKHVLSLKQFLSLGESTGLSRSASDATDRKSPAYVTQKSVVERSNLPKEEITHFSLRKKDQKVKKNSSLRGAIFRTGSSSGKHSTSGHGSQKRASTSYYPTSVPSPEGTPAMSRASSSSSLSSLELPDLLVSISDCAKDLMDYSKQQFMRLKGLEILEASYKNTETSFKKLQGAYGTSSDNPNEKKPTISSQERESLRCALEKLEKDRAAFQSEKQTMLRKIEKEQRQLAMEKTKLEEETRKYKEEAETLQIQIDNFYSQTRNCTGARISGLSSRSSVPSEGSVSATESTGDSDSARTLLDRAATSPPHPNSTSNLMQKTTSQPSLDHPQSLPSGRPSVGAPRLRAATTENGGPSQGEGSKSTVDGAMSRPPPAVPGRASSVHVDSTKATPTTTTKAALPTQLASKSKSRSNTFKKHFFPPR